MDEPRLKAKLWVQAALRMADLAGRPGAVLRRGDADAGGVLAVLRDADGGMCVLSQTRDRDGGPAWMRATGPAPVDQALVHGYVARRVANDPDLWVVEFDAPGLRAPFAATMIG